MLRRIFVPLLACIIATVTYASVVTLDGVLAYTRSAGYPASCTCAEDGVTTEECDLFQCSCACDLNAGMCDYNCCCDPDCSDAQKSRFSEVGCADQGSTPKKTQLCYDSVDLYKINPRLPLGGEPTVEASVGGALCVEKYNGATELEYFKDTAVQTADIFTVTAGKKDYNYGDKSEPSATLDVNFDQGDSIAAFSGASSAALYSVDTGFFSIPAADSDGRCNDNNFAGFEEDVSPRSCQRELTSVNTNLYEEQCVKDFSVARYVEELYLASAANVRATTANPNAVVNVTLGTVFHLDQSTNVATDKTSSWATCATAYFADLATYSAGSNTCRFADVVGLADVPYCQNVVSSAEYVVTHDATAAGTITSVVANVVITDLPRDASAPSETFTQTFGVNFVSSFGGSTSQGSANEVARMKSGNPGYLMGKPVLVGTLQAVASGSSLQTISMSTDGFQVSSSMLAYDDANPGNFGSGKCPAGTAQGHQTLGFGYDMVSGCQLELTRAELQDLCCEGSSDCTSAAPSAYAPDDGVGFPYFLSLPAADQYVGLYGNADPLDVKQWTKVNVRSSSANPNWNANTGVCKNMRSGLHYKFLVASSGEKNFPQSKIVGVEVEHIVRDWVTDIPNGDVYRTQTFSLEVISSFVFKESTDLEGYVPPAPPVLFKVPHDVFYPFFMSPAAPKAGLSALSALSPVVCILALVGMQWLL